MKVGLCGLGDRLGYLAELFRNEIPGFDLVAYADPAPTGLRRIGADRVRRMTGYASLERMLDGETLDLVMIGSPNRFHRRQLSLVLAAGVRAFCEKPVVTSEEQTFDLLEQLRGRDADCVIVGLVLRYAPLYVDLANLVESRVLGDILSMEASEHIEPAHGAFFFRDWRRKTSLSGGYLLEKCCHDLDLYAALVKSRARRVASFGDRSIFTERYRHLDREPVYRRRASRWRGTDSPFSGDADIVDRQVALIEYENGAKLCFHTSLHAPDESRRFCIVGSEGMAEGDFARGYLKAHRAVSGDRVFEADYRDDEVSMHYGAERRMAADLTRHFESGAPLPVSVLDGLKAGLTALKIDESRVLGQIVDLKDVWARFDALAERPIAAPGNGRRPRRG